MSSLPFLGNIFLGAFLITWALRTQAPRLNLLDIPMTRSSHILPTPRGGGLSICVLFCFSITHFYLSGFISQSEFFALLGAQLIAILGFIDDLYKLSLQWRLPVQFLAAIWVVISLEGVAPIDFGFILLSNKLILGAMGVTALVWVLNLYNFMDGIDGIATIELLFVTAMLLIFSISTGDQVIGALSAVLLSAGAGFLFWNWPPAKIFLGDVGSNFIGFVLGVLALISMQHQSLTVWTWLILLGVFVVDTTVTLVVRVSTGHSWYEGHASHAYQNAARFYNSHFKVMIIVLGINFLWLAPIAWFSVQLPEYGLLFCTIALSPLIFLALRLKAGRFMKPIN
tara:strand:+ start:394 stop:1413 length:1020 start_codon:yes stop_codon:yes gene_type:complete